MKLARDTQLRRFKGKSTHTNSAMNTRLVREHFKLDAESAGYLEDSLEQMNFSTRAHDRILNVARTSADFGGI